MTRLEQARAILGDDLLGPEEIKSALGEVPVVRKPPAVPFTKVQLESAKAHGEMLVLRSPVDAEGMSLTISRFVALYPDLFDARFLRNVGYQLKTEWGIELEPLATEEACGAGWALVTKDLLASTINRDYPKQQESIAAHAARAGAPETSVRRRTAVEAVHDLILYRQCRGTCLLANAWDWTSSRTVDGGFLSVGGFGKHGLQIFGFSPGVHHGALGACATRGRPS